MGDIKVNHPHQFKFKNKIYECIGEDRDWQITQFKFAIKDKQWLTVSNLYWSSWRQKLI